MADAFLPDRLRQAGQRLRGMATQAAQHVTGQLRNGAPSAPTSPLLDKINASSHEQRLEELKEASWAQDVDDEVAVFYSYCRMLMVKDFLESTARRWSIDKPKNPTELLDKCTYENCARPPFSRDSTPRDMLELCEADRRALDTVRALVIVAVAVLDSVVRLRMDDLLDDGGMQLALDELLGDRLWRSLDSAKSNLAEKPAEKLAELAKTLWEKAAGSSAATIWETAPDALLCSADVCRMSMRPERRCSTAWLWLLGGAKFQSPQPLRFRSSAELIAQLDSTADHSSLPNEALQHARLVRACIEVVLLHSVPAKRLADIQLRPELDGSRMEFVEELANLAFEALNAVQAHGASMVEIATLPHALSFIKHVSLHGDPNMPVPGDNLLSLHSLPSLSELQKSKKFAVLAYKQKLESLRREVQRRRRQLLDCLKEPGDSISMEKIKEQLQRGQADLTALSTTTTPLTSAAGDTQARRITDAAVIVGETAVVLNATQVAITPHKELMTVREIALPMQGLFVEIEEPSGSGAADERAWWRTYVPTATFTFLQYHADLTRLGDDSGTLYSGADLLYGVVSQSLLFNVPDIGVMRYDRARGSLLALNSKVSLLPVTNPYMIYQDGTTSRQPGSEATGADVQQAALQVMGLQVVQPRGASNQTLQKIQTVWRPSGGQQPLSDMTNSYARFGGTLPALEPPILLALLRTDTHKDLQTRKKIFAESSVETLDRSSTSPLLADFLPRNWRRFLQEQADLALPTLDEAYWKRRLLLQGSDSEGRLLLSVLDQKRSGVMGDYTPVLILPAADFHALVATLQRGFGGLHPNFWRPLMLCFTLARNNMAALRSRLAELQASLCFAVVFLTVSEGVPAASVARLIQTFLSSPGFNLQLILQYQPQVIGSLRLSDVGDRMLIPKEVADKLPSGILLPEIHVVQDERLHQLFNVAAALLPQERHAGALTAVTTPSWLHRHVSQLEHRAFLNRNRRLSQWKKVVFDDWLQRRQPASSGFFIVLPRLVEQNMLVELIREHLEEETALAALAAPGSSGNLDAGGQELLAVSSPSSYQMLNAADTRFYEQLDAFLRRGAERRHAKVAVSSRSAIIIVQSADLLTLQEKQALLQRLQRTGTPTKALFVVSTVHTTDLALAAVDHWVDVVLDFSHAVPLLIWSGPLRQTRAICYAAQLLLGRMYTLDVHAKVEACALQSADPDALVQAVVDLVHSDLVPLDNSAKLWLAAVLGRLRKLMSEATVNGEDPRLLPSFDQFAMCSSVGQLYEAVELWRLYWDHLLQLPDEPECVDMPDVAGSAAAGLPLLELLRWNREVVTPPHPAYYTRCRVDDEVQACRYLQPAAARGEQLPWNQLGAALERHPPSAQQLAALLGSTGQPLKLVALFTPRSLHTILQSASMSDLQYLADSLSWTGSLGLPHLQLAAQLVGAVDINSSVCRAMTSPQSSVMAALSVLVFHIVQAQSQQRHVAQLQLPRFEPQPRVELEQCHLLAMISRGLFFNVTNQSAPRLLALLGGMDEPVSLFFDQPDLLAWLRDGCSVQELDRYLSQLPVWGKALVETTLHPAITSGQAVLGKTWLAQTLAKVHRGAATDMKELVEAAPSPHPYFSAASVAAMLSRLPLAAVADLCRVVFSCVRPSLEDGTVDLVAYVLRCISVSGSKQVLDTLSNVIEFLRCWHTSTELPPLEFEKLAGRQDCTLVQLLWAAARGDVDVQQQCIRQWSRVQAADGCPGGAMPQEALPLEHESTAELRRALLQHWQSQRGPDQAKWEQELWAEIEQLKRPAREQLLTTWSLIRRQDTNAAGPTDQHAVTDQMVACSLWLFCPAHDFPLQPEPEPQNTHLQREVFQFLLRAAKDTATGFASRVAQSVDATALAVWLAYPSHLPLALLQSFHQRFRAVGAEPLVSQRFLLGQKQGDRKLYIEAFAQGSSGKEMLQQLMAQPQLLPEITNRDLQLPLKALPIIVDNGCSADILKHNLRALALLLHADFGPTPGGGMKDAEFDINVRYMVNLLLLWFGGLGLDWPCLQEHVGRWPGATGGNVHDPLARLRDKDPHFIEKAVQVPYPAVIDTHLHRGLSLLQYFGSGNQDLALTRQALMSFLPVDENARASVTVEALRHDPKNVVHQAAERLRDCLWSPPFDKEKGERLVTLLTAVLRTFYQAGEKARRHAIELLNEFLNIDKLVQTVLRQSDSSAAAWMSRWVCRGIGFSVYTGTVDRDNPQQLDQTPHRLLMACITCLMTWRNKGLKLCRATVQEAAFSLKLQDSAEALDLGRRLDEMLQQPDLTVPLSEHVGAKPDLDFVGGTTGLLLQWQEDCRAAAGRSVALLNADTAQVPATTVAATGGPPPSARNTAAGSVVGEAVEQDGSAVAAAATPQERVEVDNQPVAIDMLNWVSADGSVSYDFENKEAIVRAPSLVRLRRLAAGSSEDLPLHVHSVELLNGPGGVLVLDDVLAEPDTPHEGLRFAFIDKRDLVHVDILQGRKVVAHFPTNELAWRFLSQRLPPGSLVTGSNILLKMSTTLHPMFLWRRQHAIAVGAESAAADEEQAATAVRRWNLADAMVLGPLLNYYDLTAEVYDLLALLTAMALAVVGGEEPLPHLDRMTVSSWIGCILDTYAKKRFSAAVPGAELVKLTAQFEEQLRQLAIAMAEDVTTGMEGLEEKFRQWLPQEETADDSELAGPATLQGNASSAEGPMAAVVAESDDDELYDDIHNRFDLFADDIANAEGDDAPVDEPLAASSALQSLQEQHRPWATTQSFRSRLLVELSRLLQAVVRCKNQRTDFVKDMLSANCRRLHPHVFLQQLNNAEIELQKSGYAGFSLLRGAEKKEKKDFFLVYPQGPGAATGDGDVAKSLESWSLRGSSGTGSTSSINGAGRSLFACRQQQSERDQRFLPPASGSHVFIVAPAVQSDALVIRESASSGVGDAAVGATANMAYIVQHAKDVDARLLKQLAPWLIRCLLAAIDAPLMEWMVDVALFNVRRLAPPTDVRTRLIQHIVAYALADTITPSTDAGSDQPASATAMAADTGPFLLEALRLPPPYEQFFRHVGGVYALFNVDRAWYSRLVYEFKVPLRLVDVAQLQAQGVVAIDQVYAHLVRCFSPSCLVVYVRGLRRADDLLLKWAAEHTKAVPYHYFYFEELDLSRNFSEIRDRFDTSLYHSPSLVEIELEANRGAEGELDVATPVVAGGVGRDLGDVVAGTDDGGSDDESEWSADEGDENMANEVGSSKGPTSLPPASRSATAASSGGSTGPRLGDSAATVAGVGGARQGPPLDNHNRRTVEMEVVNFQNHSDRRAEPNLAQMVDDLDGSAEASTGATARRPGPNDRTRYKGNWKRDLASWVTEDAEAALSVFMIISPPGAGKTRFIEDKVCKIWMDQMKAVVGGLYCYFDASSSRLVETSLVSLLERECGHVKLPHPLRLVVDEYHMLSEDQKKLLFTYVDRRSQSGQVRAILIGNRYEKYDKDMAEEWQREWAGRRADGSRQEQQILHLCRLPVLHVRSLCLQKGCSDEDAEFLHWWYAAARALFADDVLTLRNVPSAIEALKGHPRHAALTEVLLRKAPDLHRLTCQQFSYHVEQFYRRFAGTLWLDPSRDAFSKESLKLLAEEEDINPWSMLVRAALVSVFAARLELPVVPPQRLRRLLAEETGGTADDEESSLGCEPDHCIRLSFAEYCNLWPGSARVHPVVRLAAWVHYIYESLPFGVKKPPATQDLRRLLLVDQPVFPLVMNVSPQRESLERCRAFVEVGDYTDLEWIRSSLQRNAAVSWSHARKVWASNFISDVGALMRLLEVCPDRQSCLMAMSPVNLGALVDMTVGGHVDNAQVADRGDALAAEVIRYMNHDQYRRRTADAGNPLFHAVWNVYLKMIRAQRLTASLRETVERALYGGSGGDAEASELLESMLLWAARFGAEQVGRLGSGGQGQGEQRLRHDMKVVMQRWLARSEPRVFDAHVNTLYSAAFAHMAPDAAAISLQAHECRVVVSLALQTYPGLDVWPASLRLLCQAFHQPDVASADLEKMALWRLFSCGQAAEPMSMALMPQAMEVFDKSMSTFALPAENHVQQALACNLLRKSRPESLPMVWQLAFLTQLQQPWSAVGDDLLDLLRDVQYLAKTFERGLWALKRSTDIWPKWTTEQGKELRNELDSRFRTMHLCGDRTLSADPGALMAQKMEQRRLQQMQEEMKQMEALLRVQNPVILRFYNSKLGEAGLLKAQNVEVDEYKNPKGIDFDLARKDAFAGINVLVGDFSGVVEFVKLELHGALSAEHERRTLLGSGWLEQDVRVVDGELWVTLDRSEAVPAVLSNRVQVSSKRHMMRELPRDLLQQTILPRLQGKGFDVEIVESVTRFSQLLEKASVAGGVAGTKSLLRVAWVISGSEVSAESEAGSAEKAAQHAHELAKACQKFHNAGGGLLIFGENQPLFWHANVVLRALGGPTLEGNNRADLYVVSRTVVEPMDEKSDGQLKEHNHVALTGIRTLYEGKTVCQPAAGPLPTSWKALVTGGLREGREQPQPAEGEEARIYGPPQPLVLAKEAERQCGRVIVDMGYTKLWLNWTKGGTDRYITNVTAWLTGIDLAVRGLRKDEEVGDSSAVGLLLRQKPRVLPADMRRVPTVEALQQEVVRKLPPAIDVMLVVDMSGSMYDYFVQLRDFCAQMVDKFAIGRSRNRMGLVTFGSSAYVVAPLGSHEAALRAAIANLNQSLGGTAFAPPLQLAVNEFNTHAHESNSKLVIFQTDGYNSDRDATTQLASKLIDGLQCRSVAAVVSGDWEVVQGAQQVVGEPGGYRNADKSALVLQLDNCDALVRGVDQIVRMARAT